MLYVNEVVGTTAILSIETVCQAQEFQVPEKSYNIRPLSYIRDFFPYIRPWSYKRVVLCSGKAGNDVHEKIKSGIYSVVAGHLVECLTLFEEIDICVMCLSGEPDRATFNLLEGSSSLNQVRKYSKILQNWQMSLLWHELAVGTASDRCCYLVCVMST